MTAKYPVPTAALKESVAIIGRTGSGKTFAAKGAVETLLADGARVCIIDPTGVWFGLRSSADGKKPMFSIVVFGGDHADVPITDTSGAALATLVGGQNLPAIVDLSEFSRAGMARFMGPFLDALYKANRQPLTLVIDESDLFAPQRPEPETANMLGRMEQIVRRGRVRGFRPWLITQRPASLNKNVLSQANTLIAMQLTAPQDRDALGAWIEGQADRDEGKKILAELPKMQKGEGYVWSPSHDVLERVKFPPIKTFDSSRAPEDGEVAPQVKVADVDLSAITESLRAVEKEAEANDPRLLRKRIAELQGQLASPTLTGQDRELERRRGKIEGYAAAIDALQPMVDRMRTLKTALDEQLGDLLGDLDRWRAKQESAAELREIEATKPAKAREFVNRSPIRQLGSLLSTGNGALPRAERLILTALAQYPQGRSKVQVAILTGYAVGGGGFSNSVSALRTKGYLEGDAARLTITSGGIAALGIFEPLPRGRDLLAHWLGQLGKAERKALEALAEVYPRTLTKAQVANRAGYEANGGGFNNAISRLRTLELVRGRAELKASDDLF